MRETFFRLFRLGLGVVAAAAVTQAVLLSWVVVAEVVFGGSRKLTKQIQNSFVTLANGDIGDDVIIQFRD